MSEGEDLAALREQTSQGNRINEASEEADQQEFVDDIVAELEAIENGENQKTVSVWDGHLAAFIRALEENPERMESVGRNLQQRLDFDESEVDRSEVLRLALRLGFQQAAPEEFEAIREAAQQQATKKL
jgi:rRNA maturation protein Rpf1